MDAEEHDVVDDVQAYLLKNEFRLVQDQTSESFGNRLARYQCRDLDIRFMRDHGQWLLEAKPLSEDEWFSIDVWHSCLTGGELANEPPSIDRAILLLKRDISALMSAATSPRDVISCLRSSEKKRIADFLGVDVDDIH